MKMHRMYGSVDASDTQKIRWFATTLETSHLEITPNVGFGNLDSEEDSLDRMFRTCRG